MKTSFKRAIYLRHVFVCLGILFAFTLPTPAYSQTEQPVVRAVLFHSPVCFFCREIVKEELPPKIEKFGEQLEIFTVDVDTPEGLALYEVALEKFGEEMFVPHIIIGEEIIGGADIPTRVPEIVEKLLAQGGQDWPEIPGLFEYMAKAEGSSGSVGEPGPGTTSADSVWLPGKMDEAVVRVIMFWMEGCSHCHDVIEDVLPPLQTKYQDRLEVLLVELVTLDDIDRLYELGAHFGLSKEAVGVPFLIIGSQALLGSQEIPAMLPELIEDYLAAGGVDYPFIPLLKDWIPGRIGALPIAHLVMFWTPDCHECQEVVAEAIHHLQEQYGEQVRIQYVDIVTSEDVLWYYEIASALGIRQEDAKIPMILIGEEAVVGAEAILDRLPELVAVSLTDGGAAPPDLVALANKSASPDNPGINIPLTIVLFGMVIVLVLAGWFFLRQRKTSAAGQSQTD